MASFFRWKPSKTQKRAFAEKMNEIDEFIEANGISASSTRDSYYFTINGKEYRVSNHSVESSPWHAEINGKKRFDDVTYIHASKTRIIEIYTALKNGVELDGRGNEKITNNKI